MGARNIKKPLINAPQMYYTIIIYCGFLRMEGGSYGRQTTRQENQCYRCRQRRPPPGRRPRHGSGRLRTDGRRLRQLRRVGRPQKKRRRQIAPHDDHHYPRRALRRGRRRFKRPPGRRQHGQFLHDIPGLPGHRILNFPGHGLLPEHRRRILCKLRIFKLWPARPAPSSRRSKATAPMS